MMSEYKVSVVMPVYNTACYVGAALESIVNQTLLDIEILVIDDGSTDGSLQVIEEFASQDARIKVWSQSNQGQSLTRNFGIAQATGRFIYFMDSDDLLEPDALQTCHTRCVRDELDFVFFEAETFQDTPSIGFSMDYHYTNVPDGTMVGVDVLKFLLDTSQFRVSPCLIFIRSSYLKTIGLSFPPIIHEDQPFCVLLYLQSNRVGYIQRSFFHRRVRPTSTMTNRMSSRNIKGYFTGFELLTRFASSQREKVRQVIRQHRKITLNAVFFTAYRMTLWDKIGLMRRSLRPRYLFLLNPKNIAILFLKGL